jgi:hypothetical protein
MPHLEIMFSDLQIVKSGTTYRMSRYSTVIQRKRETLSQNAVSKLGARYNIILLEDHSFR